MLEIFFPKEHVDSVYDVDFIGLYEKGYRGLIFDIDNTLVPHGAPATEEAVGFFRKLREIGYETCLISNNKEERVKPFAEAVESAYIHKAKKPDMDSYIRAMHLMQCNVHNTCFVGDQIFTDIFGANRTGIHSILVKPIHPSEEIQIVLKRKLEKIVLHFYKKQKKQR